MEIHLSNPHVGSWSFEIGPDDKPKLIVDSIEIKESECTSETSSPAPSTAESPSTD